MSVPEEWFRDWFGETYLALYPHRDRAEARAAVRLVEERIGPRRGAWALDLACGAGRHLAFLRAAGLRPVGLDLSAPLLREARRNGEATPLVRADMRRIPFASHAFDLLVSFFTSFGYFSTREEDESVAREARRVLRPGGRFLLDYLNAEHVRAGLVAEDEREVGGRRVRQRRWTEGGAVVKRIEVETGAGEPEVHHERVRLYEPEELEALLGRAGLRVGERLGDYDGRPHDVRAPRLILIGEAA